MPTDPLNDDPSRDMSASGWKKETTYKYVSLDTDARKLTVTEVDFYVKDQVCTCKSSDFLWLAPQRNGVYLACLYCGSVVGPITQEAGVVRKTYEATSDEAIAILRSQGSQIRDRDIQQIIRVFKKPARNLSHDRPRPK